MGRVWYTDENAIVRQKVEEAVVQQRAPLLAAIVRQGVQEGVFTDRPPGPGRRGPHVAPAGHGEYPCPAAALAGAGAATEPGRIEAIVAIHAAYMDAIERAVGRAAELPVSHRRRSGEGVGEGGGQTTTSTGRPDETAGGSRTHNLASTY